MPRKKFVLLDVEKQVSLNPFYYTAADAEEDGIGMIHPGTWEISSTFLKGGLSDGVMMVTLDNGHIELDIIPTRGMGILRAKAGSIPVGWNSPVGPMPVNPAFVNLHSRNKLGWLDGFNELFCRCGLAFNGPPGIDEGNPSPIETDLTLHGLIANRPAHKVFVEVDNDEETISVTGIIEETTLFGPMFELTAKFTLKMGDRSIYVDDQVKNLGASPTEFELLYHCNVGQPFLEGGSKFVTAAEAVSPRDETAANGIDTWPDYLPPTVGYAEEAYFLNLKPDGNGNCSTLLTNASGNLGFGMDFDHSQYPAFTLWKNTQGLESGYCTGLEPGINFPNPKAFEREKGRVKVLQPSEVWNGSVTLKTHISESEVTAAIERIEKIQGADEPLIHSNTVSDFSPN